MDTRGKTEAMFDSHDGDSIYVPAKTSEHCPCFSQHDGHYKPEFTPVKSTLKGKTKPYIG